MRVLRKPQRQANSRRVLISQRHQLKRSRSRLRTALCLARQIRIAKLLELKEPRRARTLPGNHPIRPLPPARRALRRCRQSTETIARRHRRRRREDQVAERVRVSRLRQGVVTVFYIVGLIAGIAGMLLPLHSLFRPSQSAVSKPSIMPDLQSFGERYERPAELEPAGATPLPPIDEPQPAPKKKKKLGKQQSGQRRL